jgi:hypothetical protein
VIKHNFDQTPILLENFDQLIRSSEIRSTDPLSEKHLKNEIVFADSVDTVAGCSKMRIKL